MKRWTSGALVGWLAVAGSSGLGGCGPASTNADDDNGDDDDMPGGPDANTGCQGAGCFNFCPAGTQTTLRGVVTAPNGIDPVPGALVYIPREVTEFPDEVACEICDQISDLAVVSATTGFDGRFTLGPIPTTAGQAPGATVNIVSQKGRFRRLAQVPIQSPCETNTGANELFRLPGRTMGYNNIPKIAVATGDWDVMECVLLKLGLEQGSFDLYSGLFFDDGSATVDSFDALLTDAARMKDYNIIFINCTGDTFEDLLTQPAVRTNIEDYVLSGGRLYVTDRSYDYVEQIPEFSPLIDFGPGASNGSPETANAAYVGDDGITTEALVLDQGLAQWLGAVEAVSGDEIISADGRVHVGHFLSGWSMQYAVATVDNVKVWLQGQVSGTGLSGDLPLTTTFDYQQCGRVLYSSYHTSGRDEFGGLGGEGFPSYCSLGEPLTPQERVLEYLILHIADCIVVE